jgi:uncharacterized repeat protein (TIGR03803 family)
MNCTHLQNTLSKALILAALGLAVGTAHAQTYSVVYDFGMNVGDPATPVNSGMIAQGRDGSLYSSTSAGGTNPGYGATYSITPDGSLTLLDSFGPSGGSLPNGGLTLGGDGNFYGTTYGGGNPGPGTIFQMTPSGGLTTWYNFTNGSDGEYPDAPPIEGTDGNFYGTSCSACNSGGNGAIYKITPAKKFTVLYAFDGTHGQGPMDPLIQGTDGNFYGTTAFGGKNGLGVVFKITPAGGLTVIYNFDGTHGSIPSGPLLQGSNGNFYGTTGGGGSFSGGVIFKLTPAGKYTVLHNLNLSTDGGGPVAGLVQATDGNFYGATSQNGPGTTNCPSGCGTLFKITPSGVFSVIHSFDVTDGEIPQTTMIQHTNGVLYGTASEGGMASMCPFSSCGVLYSVNIGAAPFVTFVGTPAAKVGKTVELLGQGLTGLSGVSFNSTPATFTFVSDTYITATVPNGATSGSVTVTTPGGTLTSSKTFRVTPQIKSFAPPSGVVGSEVVITGVSLTQTSKVTFGGVAAAFTVNSDTQVTATVPTGAKTGKIVITTPGGTATSATDFTVTT